MISLLGNSEQLAHSAYDVSLALGSAASWMSKNVQSISSSPLINAAKTGLDYTTPLSRNALFVAGYETAVGLYESHKADGIETEAAMEASYEEENENKELSQLQARKEAYEELCNEPLVSGKETFTTLATTSLSTVAFSTGLAMAAFPATITGTATTMGFTLGARVLKKGMYAYKIKQLDAQIATIAAKLKSKREKAKKKLKSTIAMKHNLLTIASKSVKPRRSIQVSKWLK